MPFTTAARHLAAALLAALLAPAAQAQEGLLADFIPNYAAFGIGSTTRYTGSSERVAIAGPLARYEFADKRYLLELVGPMLDLNLLSGSSWRFGPSGNLRFGRSEVEDPVVKQLPEIDATIELGAYLAWTYLQEGPRPWAVRAGVHVWRDVGNVSDGWTATAGGSFWLPLSAQLFVGVGAGLSWGDSAFMRTYYGVDEVGSAASGLPVYRPGGGVRQWYAWPSMIYRVDEHWLVGGGLFYQYLVGGAADSPIVRDRGERGQLSYGIGVGYAWK
jgi:outer membrane protein